MRSYYGLLCGIPAGGDIGWRATRLQHRFPNRVGQVQQSARLATPSIMHWQRPQLGSTRPKRSETTHRSGAAHSPGSPTSKPSLRTGSTGTTPANSCTDSAAHRRSNTTPTTMHTAPNDQPVPDNPVGTKPGTVHNASEACTCRSGPTSRNRAPSPVQWWSGIDRGGRRVS
jgi:hypothetical protein